MRTDLGAIVTRTIRGTDAAVQQALVTVLGAPGPVAVNLGSAARPWRVLLFGGFRGVEVAGTIGDLDICFHSRRLEARPASPQQHPPHGDELEMLQFRYDAIAARIDAEALRRDSAGARFAFAERRATDRGFVDALRRDVLGNVLPLEIEIATATRDVSRAEFPLRHREGAAAGTLSVVRYRPFDITQLHVLLRLNGSVGAEQIGAMSAALGAWVQGYSVSDRRIALTL